MEIIGYSLKTRLLECTLKSLVLVPEFIILEFTLEKQF